MIAATITFVLTNLPAIMLVLAFVLAAAVPGVHDFPARLLDWTLLLAFGFTGLWSAFYHVAFGEMAAAYIGWQPSPFQFEVGMADLAIGVTAIVAFWRGMEFKAAAILAASVFFLGDAVGHVHQMMATGNFAPGNAGVPFITDIAVPVLAIALWFKVRRRVLPAALSA
jgi:hypothetical protein